MQRFNSSNTEALFIKNLLKNTYLPIAPTIREGDYMVAESLYCYKNTLVRCVKSGTLTKGGKTIPPYTGDTTLCSNKLICGVGIKASTYEIIQAIDYNHFYPGLNSNYTSSSEFYDTETHIRLGNYLRWYRDVHGIDLMSMYNCFCDKSTSYVHINNKKMVDGSSPNVTVWLIPIQLNRNYTIFINSPYKVSIGSSFLNNKGRKLNPTSNNYIDAPFDHNIVEYEELTYNTPVHYSNYTHDSTIMSYNNNFYMVIQVNTRNFTPIVVLEGNYDRRYQRVINGNFDEQSFDDFDFSKFVCPSLTLHPSSYFIPYSQRLMEFLTENTITSDEDIPMNVMRIQNALNKRGTHIIEDDVWSDEVKVSVIREHLKYENKNYLKSHQLT
jgi:hypothetical protein